MKRVKKIFPPVLLLIGMTFFFPIVFYFKYADLSSEISKNIAYSEAKIIDSNYNSTGTNTRYYEYFYHKKKYTGKFTVGGAFNLYTALQRSNHVGLRAPIIIAIDTLTPENSIPLLKDEFLAKNGCTVEDLNGKVLEYHLIYGVCVVEKKE